MITLDMDERLEYAQYIICLDYSVVSEYTCTHRLVHEMSEVLLERNVCRFQSIKFWSSILLGYAMYYLCTR